MYGLITGSGFYDIADLVDRTSLTVDTPFGSASLTTGTWHGQAVALLPRHGSGHSVPPAAINYRANIWALREAGAEAILATAVTGGISPAMSPGTLVLISDILNFTSGRQTTFFDGTYEPFDAHRHHTDMTHAYSPRLRSAALAAATQEGIKLVDGGVYAATNGPRFETPAEIAMMGQLGADLVGMTGYPEVALAAEAGVEYCSFGVISNFAAGLTDDIPIDEVFAVIKDAAERLYTLISATIRVLATP